MLILRKNSYLVAFLAMFCLAIHGSDAVNQPSYTLPRLHMPAPEAVVQAGQEKQARLYRQYAIKVATVIAVVGALYTTYQASQYFKVVDEKVDAITKKTQHLPMPSEQVTQPQIPSQVVAQPSSWLMAPVHALQAGAISVKNVVQDTSKCLIGALPTLMSSVLFTTFWQQASDRIAQACKQETLLGYVGEHTQLKLIFSDLLLASIPHDPWATLLSLSYVQNQMDAMLRDCAAACDGLEQQQKKSGLADDDYAHFASRELYKKYARQGSELDALQNYVVPHIAVIARAAQSKSLDQTLLFESPQQSKQNIADLCSLLIADMQKVLTFALACAQIQGQVVHPTMQARLQMRLAQIIDGANQYISSMETMLVMPAAELEQLSKNNRGMFTSTYEFERFLQEQWQTIHRYCKLM